MFNPFTDISDLLFLIWVAVSVATAFYCRNCDGEDDDS